MNFGNTVAEIQQKYEREKEKVGERECMNFGMCLPKFLLPDQPAQVGVCCVL